MTISVIVWIAVALVGSYAIVDMLSRCEDR